MCTNELHSEWQRVAKLLYCGINSVICGGGRKCNIFRVLIQGLWSEIWVDWIGRLHNEGNPSLLYRKWLFGCKKLVRFELPLHLDHLSHSELEELLTEPIPLTGGNESMIASSLVIVNERKPSNRSQRMKKTSLNNLVCSELDYYRYECGWLPRK